MTQKKPPSSRPPAAHTMRSATPSQYFFGLLPSVFCFLMLFISVSTLPLPYFKAIAPHVGVMTVFYWSMYQPKVFPFWMVFIYGLVNDTLVDIPIGFSSATLMLLGVLVQLASPLLARGGFVVVWLGFALMAGLYMLALMVCGIVAKGAEPSLGAMLMQYVITFCVFPLIYMLYNRIYHHLSPQGSSRRHAK